MKNCLLSLFLCFASWTAFGQLQFDNVKEFVNPYNYTLYTNTLFPDSSVLTTYSNSVNGGSLLAPVDLHGVGEVFDPKSAQYDYQFSKYMPYTVDSVGLYYNYIYIKEKGAAPDTLVFQFYANIGNGIDTGSYSNVSTGFPYVTYAYPEYDHGKNLGMKELGEYKYVLGSGDSYTNTGYRLLMIPTNGANGIQVKANDLFAYTVSYRPGFAYMQGDTIFDPNWLKPKNPHSNFQIFIANTPNKHSNDNYEESLTIVSRTRYNELNWKWDGKYLPGNDWVNYNQVLWSKFRVRKRPLANDARITNTKFGTTQICSGPTPITILLQDSGTANLTSAIISCKVDGNPPKNYKWTGNLSTNDTMSIAIDTFPFQAGYNEIKIWSRNPNGVLDSNPVNDTITFYILALQSPDPHFTAQATKDPQEIQFTSDTQNFITNYTWNFGDGNSSTDKNPINKYQSIGKYQVSLEVTNIQVNFNECTASFDTTISVGNTGIHTYNNSNFTVNVFPDPFQNTASIEYSLIRNTNVRIELLDMAGKEVGLIANENQLEGDHKIDINAEKYHLNPGIYLLKFMMNDQYVSRSVVKF